MAMTKEEIIEIYEERIRILQGQLDDPENDADDIRHFEAQIREAQYIISRVEAGTARWSPDGRKLEVWNIINPPREPVPNPREGHELICRLADDQLTMDWIVSNAFGLEVFEEGEWSEWYNEDGEDVDQVFGE